MRYGSAFGVCVHPRKQTDESLMGVRGCLPSRLDCKSSGHVLDSWTSLGEGPFPGLPRQHLYSLGTAFLLMRPCAVDGSGR